MCVGGKGLKNRIVVITPSSYRKGATELGARSPACLLGRARASAMATDGLVVIASVRGVLARRLCCCFDDQETWDIFLEYIPWFPTVVGVFFSVILWPFVVKGLAIVRKFLLTFARRRQMCFSCKTPGMLFVTAKSGFCPGALQLAWYLA